MSNTRRIPDQRPDLRRGSISVHPLMPGATDGLIAARTDAATVELLQQSFAAIAAQGDKIVLAFYSSLFERFPTVRSMFPADMAAQRQKLLDTLTAVIEGLAAPANVRQKLHDLGRRHAGYGARPEHYPLVCDCLVESMREVGGAAWTDQVEQEWKRALELISRIMLDGTSPHQPHGQTGPGSPPVAPKG